MTMLKIQGVLSDYTLAASRDLKYGSEVNQEVQQTDNRECD